MISNARPTPSTRLLRWPRSSRPQRLPPCPADVTVTAAVTVTRTGRLILMMSRPCLDSTSVDHPPVPWCFATFDTQRGHQLMTTYGASALARRRCLALCRNGSSCRAFAIWGEDRQLCVAHAGRHHTGPMGRFLSPSPPARYDPCRCLAYAWPIGQEADSAAGLIPLHTA